MRNDSRRDFLVKSALGLGGAALSGAVPDKVAVPLPWSVRVSQFGIETPVKARLMPPGSVAVIW